MIHYFCIKISWNQLVFRANWSYIFKACFSYLMAAGKHCTQNRRFSSTVLKIRTEAAAVELASEWSWFFHRALMIKFEMDSLDKCLNLGGTLSNFINTSIVWHSLTLMGIFSMISPRFLSSFSMSFLDRYFLPLSHTQPTF